LTGLIVITGLAAEARIARTPGVVTLAGAGRIDRLAADIETAIGGGARRLLSFGVAGALAPHLEPGDLVIGRALIDGARRAPCDPGWSAVMMERLRRSAPSLRAERSNPEIEMVAGPRIGMAQAPLDPDDAKRPQPASVTISGLLRFARNDGLAIRAFLADVSGAAAPIADPAAKAALHATTGAAAVDMESALVARAAERHGLPFAILRAIADPAHCALPPAALAAMRADGAIDVAAVLRALGREPRQLPALIRLALDSRRAFGALTRARALLGADFAGIDLGEL
jgi:adenosylhomocysteine nucleosidase